ncbi:MAG: D-alanine--D-alanine ligase [Alphaproteobacteria bacterium]|nr:D-alanine--D-alanine ligase [Alphaproteobacteria bacterium]MBU6472268.1 D-alanine--D-alanine ligase [Alphaproteobacteria bacterium]MDE2014065.1 D-alanine--D-alanine ligase [Alphaproteobacteria bacterium]MDE2073099.1 D-alanine--D-alanine ligase [Alphaproteobacteria bacterium]MDE2352100.1 D-alanine--D-alanine ligase [Alphaproteobacteria bacterium]
MRVLVLHSDVAPDAPPDELDTLVTAEAVLKALAANSHRAARAAFVPDPAALKAVTAQADVVFNLVESVGGNGLAACVAPALLEQLGLRYTGSPAAAIALTGDKPAAKRILRACGLPTPDWAEPPRWDGLGAARMIVKSATEDASVGLDDAAVVADCAAVRARAAASAARFGGRWFAESYVEGREFNIAMLEGPDGPCVLPIAEMRFVDWAAGRPKIVGYAAKWDEASPDATGTVRVFGLEAREPALAAALRELSLKSWALFGLKGYARVDFRVDEAGAPMILEINPNPCLEPLAGFGAAAAEAGLGYGALIARILDAATDD